MPPDAAASFLAVQEPPVACWRIVGFYVLFAAVPVVTAVAAGAVATTAPRWSLAAAICAAALGALLGIALERLPRDTALPPWASTVGIAGACFIAFALSDVVPVGVVAVALAFAAGLLSVICSSLIFRRKHDPESFRRQAS